MDGGRKFLPGSETELFAAAGERPATLLVLCGDRFGASRVIRSGELAARAVRTGGWGSVAMVTCTVGDHQWMLAKDCMAVKVGERAFVFALPGVVYGLAVPRGCSESAVRKLERIFRSYCAYHDLAARDGSETRNPPPESEKWILAYEKLETLAAKICTKMAAASPSVFRPAIVGIRGATSTVDNPASKIQRAVRMSAAVKLVARALVSGALIPHEHVHVSTPPAPALPSVCVLSDILDAVESRGGAVAAPPHRRREKGFWRLRAKGVELLLGVVRSYGQEVRKKPRVDAASTSESAEEALEGMKRFQPLETCG